MRAGPAALSRPSARQIQIERWEAGERTVLADVVAVEEPLEIRLAGCSVAVTMRTPGDDFDLATGFLFTEGIISSAADIASIAHCPGDTHPAGSIVNVNPRDPALVDPPRWQRNFFASSSCGVCGKAAIDAIRQITAPIASNDAPRATVTPETLSRLGESLRAEQAVFDATGGLHAAGLFNLAGDLLVLREDVGRHNAVDKVIGHRLRTGLPGNATVLMVSGRTSFEIVQKALMARIPIVAAVSAPSSLAVDLAREMGLTLAGFLRSGRFNLYAGGERILKPC